MATKKTKTEKAASDKQPDPTEPLAGTDLNVESDATSKAAQALHDSAKDADPLAGADTTVKQPFLGGKDAKKAGMAPNIPEAVMDAAHAVVNAKSAWDRASLAYRRAAEVLTHRMDSAQPRLRLVKVGDVTLRLESPETRLKLDGYKKPASEKEPKPKREPKPTKAEREAAAKKEADAKQKERTSKAKAKKGSAVANLADRRIVSQPKPGKKK